MGEWGRFLSLRQKEKPAKEGGVSLGKGGRRLVSVSRFIDQVLRRFPEFPLFSHTLLLLLHPLKRGFVKFPEGLEFILGHHDQRSRRALGLSAFGPLFFAIGGRISQQQIVAARPSDV